MTLEESKEVILVKKEMISQVEAQLELFPNIEEMLNLLETWDI